MDEESLEGAISAYRAQLQQVEAALAAGLDPAHQADLLQLREDLAQLIELTEASLISVKKSQLLASLEQTTGGGGGGAGGGGGGGGGSAKAGGDQEANGGFDHEFAAFYSELEGPSGSSAAGREEEEGEEEEEENGHDDNDEEDALGGTKVQAPYRTTWGTLEYHNAMVVGREAADGGEAQVRVLYVYPTHKSLKPCPFFLEDKCRFETNCR